MSEWDAHIPGGALDMFPQENRIPGYQYGMDANQLGTWLDYHHNLLSETHSDTAASAPVQGGIIAAVGATAKWTQVARSVPGAANLLNVWSFITGTVEGAYRALFDSTNPTTIAEGDAADPGTGVIAARITHKHAAPATWKSTAHNLLDGDRHGDTVAVTVARGMIPYGNATPKWDGLVKPSTKALLGHDATDVAWDAMAWTTWTPSAYTTNSAATWTVNSPGDEVTVAYRLFGAKTAMVSINLQTTSVSAATATLLSVALPTGWTVNRSMNNGCRVLDNGTSAAGHISALAAGTTVRIGRIDGAAFGVAIDTTAIQAQIMIELQ